MLSGSPKRNSGTKRYLAAWAIALVALFAPRPLESFERRFRRRIPIPHRARQHPSRALVLGHGVGLAFLRELQAMLDHA